MRHAINVIKASELAETSFDSVNATMKNKLLAKPIPTRRCSFTYIRTKKKVKSNTGPLKMEGNVLTQESRHMVEILNKSFDSMFTVENTSIHT